MISKSTCIHRVLEGNIHEFILTEATRQGADDLFDTVEGMLAEAYACNDMSVIAGRFLLDSRVGLLPLNYSLSRVRLMAMKYPSHPQSRTALVFELSPLTRAVDLVLRSIMLFRIYGVHEYDTALAWLREDAKADKGKV